MNRRRYLSPVTTSPSSSPSRSHRISVQALTEACAMPKLLHLPEQPRSLHAASPNHLPYLPPQAPHPHQHLPALSFRQTALTSLATPFVPPPPPPPLHAAPSTLRPQQHVHLLPSAHYLTPHCVLPPQSHYYPLQPPSSDERSVHSAPSLYDSSWRSPSYPSIHLHNNAPHSISKRPRKRGTVKRLWTPHEDDRLRCLARLRPENWNVIAESLPGRTGKQCRERWLNHLQDGIRKGFWTAREDAIILREQARRGNRWSDIARLLPGRSDNAVKNRFNATLKKQYMRHPY